MQSPPPARNYPPPTSREIISPKTGAKMAMIGIILFFAGVIIGQLIYFLSGLASYDILRDIMGVGRILSWFGVLIISMPLYTIGISSYTLDWKVRATMLSSATALIIATMIAALMFMTLPSYSYY